MDNKKLLTYSAVAAGTGLGAAGISAIVSLARKQKLKKALLKAIIFGGSGALAGAAGTFAVDKGLPAFKKWRAARQEAYRKQRTIEQDVARQYAESLFHGALQHSVRQGGNGKRLFPKDYMQIRQLVPPIVDASVRQPAFKDFFSNRPELSKRKAYKTTYTYDPNKDSFQVRVGPRQGYFGSTYILQPSSASTQGFSIRKLDDVK